jgi:hypothetical protein
MRNSAKSAALAAAVAAAAGTAVTGCASLSSQAAPPASRPTAGSSAALAVSPAPSAVPASPASAVPAAPASSGPAPAAAPVPVLGRLAGVFAQGSGFGQARPVKIFNGGDPTGLVTKMTWKSWGAPQATASGTAEWVGPGQSVATGTAQPVAVVAFKLGTCHGIRMYKAVEWYFPQHGEAFDPGRYENVCAGRYVPGAGP